MKKTTTLILSLVASLAVAQKNSPIRVNQVGYYPNAPKLAAVEADGAAKKYTLRDAKTHKTVWSGTASASNTSPWSGKTRQWVDFSSVTQPGVYELCAGKEKQQVVIRPQALSELAKASVKAFYLQRSGEPIEEQYAGRYARPLGHPDTRVMIHPSAASSTRPAGSFISSPGGWYDAGDYNKYIVNSGFSIGLMLYAYQQNTAYFDAMQLGIPPSKVGLPDYLEEIAVNLRWMQTMQDPEDGGVYHKLTTPNFEGFVMPGECKQQRYVVMKSTAAALDLAATFAQASRVYGRFPQCRAWADELLTQAIKAYQWAKRNPKVLYNQDEMNRHFDPDVQTGTYGDMQLDDEWLWATVELEKTVLQHISAETLESCSKHFSIPSWGNVAGLALYAALTDDETAETKSYDKKTISAQLLRLADERLAGIPTSCYASAYGYQASDFAWGCNAEAGAGAGIVLLQAYRLTHDKRYLNAALGVADYMLGRNATGYCYVTGFGTFSSRHPHQRLSAADGIDDPMPGFLVGGPNPGQQDKEYCKTYTSNQPDESYTDDVDSYASNEIAINWNASLAAFAGWLDAEMSR